MYFTLFASVWGVHARPEMKQSFFSVVWDNQVLISIVSCKKMSNTLGWKKKTGNKNSVVEFRAQSREEMRWVLVHRSLRSPLWLLPWPRSRRGASRRSPTGRRRYLSQRFCERAKEGRGRPNAPSEKRPWSSDHGRAHVRWLTDIKKSVY